MDRSIVEDEAAWAGCALGLGDADASEGGDATFQERELRYRALLDAIPAAVYTTDAAGRITFFNEACVAFAGRRPRIGDDEWCVSWRLRQPDGTPLAHDQCPMAVAVREGRPVHGAEALAERPDGALVPFLAYPTPLRDASGALVGGVNMLVDISHRKEVEQRLKLLSEQVNHRANNLLAVVLATVRLTEADTVAAFKTALQGRIQTLAHAHSLLARSQWCGVDLHSLLTHGLVSHLGDEAPRVWISGPDHGLGPATAQGIALAVHELAANAARHGALSGRHGQVNAHWRLEPDRGLVLYWTETGGPPIASAPEAKVGLKVLERAVKQFDGCFTLNWRSEGLQCEIVAPCSAS